MPELRQEYLDILEKREWSVSGYTDDGRVELEWWSPAGEDFLVCVNVENFPDEIEDKDAKEIARLVDDIKFCIERPTLNPTASLCELANKDPELFMEYYEKLHEKYRWRKNSVIAKLYAAGKEGKLANLNRQKFFEDENFVAYTMGDRAYIKFVMKPRQQLIVALKSRKWWWNSNEEAWSTYLDKLDKEWVQSISTRYADYV